MDDRVRAYIGSLADRQLLQHETKLKHYQRFLVLEETFDVAAVQGGGRRDGGGLRGVCEDKIRRSRAAAAARRAIYERGWMWFEWIAVG